jgi:2-polyprenyl-3-methyl-5-hydroxy-6-metoxy-1,4-benzoquinol methylase
MRRTLKPELLDQLPWDSPEARASRADLKRLNGLMGNYRYLARRIQEEAGSGKLCLEIGAGEGMLAGYLKNRPCTVTGLDQIPRPSDWPASWPWEQGNLFESENIGRAHMIIGALILHHFDDDALNHLGRKFHSQVKCLIFIEPARRWWSHGWAALTELTGLHPVTRHDMHVSIRAGFRSGEISDRLGLSRDDWYIREWEDWRGTVRMEACRT